VGGGSWCIPLPAAMRAVLLIVNMVRLALSAIAFVSVQFL